MAVEKFVGTIVSSGIGARFRTFQTFPMVLTLPTFPMLGFFDGAGLPVSIMTCDSAV